MVPYVTIRYVRTRLVRCVWVLLHSPISLSFQASAACLCRDYGNTGCRVFKQGLQNWKDFCLKINIPRENYEILRIGVMGIRILDFTTLPALPVSVKMAN